MRRNFLSQFRPGALSLKTVLAIYFVPIAVLPSIFLSYYAISEFKNSTKETLVRRASSERDAIVAEIDSLEGELLGLAHTHASLPRLLQAVRAQDRGAMSDVMATFRENLWVRLYSPDGRFLVGRRAAGEGESHIPYISRDGLHKVRARGETLDRYYFTEANKGFITVVRCLLKDSRGVHGILEEEYLFGSRDLADLKGRRQVDVVFLSRDFHAVAASFALSNEMVQSFSSVGFQSKGLGGSSDPVYVRLGDARYAGFLFDLPASLEKVKKWGYLAVFVSMTTVDATVGKLKLAMLYLTALFILVAALLILIFSNRLVRPIEMLVNAMKRMKTGRTEQIPPLDTTYEIEYLVHAFNEMARNVSAAKRTLELKLEELHRANLEIKNTQSHLVQSAKMISLGQIVAGVAHELNNPIAFIYSNMHHLSEYVQKIQELVQAYRASYGHLSPKDRAKMEKLEKDLEIDFILKDMVDLTRSCVEGANRTKEIVLGLRTFSRMDQAEFRAADLHEGLRSTMRLLVTELKDRVQIHEEFGELPFVECSISQMNQVFMNLISNGAQAIEGKGEIWIRTRREGDEAVIEIEDTGCGISPDALEKIFDPFFTTKKVGQGTGLGLSIAYGLIQKHHGSIAVSSRVGQGTCFTLRLPIRQPVAAAAG